jgi:1-acyl-sn-glycerol-3-phosphate acyltransferase
MKALLVFLVRLLTGASARWIACEPCDRPRVYFANHTSHLDAIVLWASLPPQLRSRTRPVAAADYWNVTAARRFLSTRLFDAILIDRKQVTAQNHPIEAILKGIEGGRSIIIFPEGTRSESGEELGEFKSGLFHLARKRPDLELVPVFLDNLNRVLPKGELLPVPMICSVFFGTPIRLEDGERKSAFLAKARSAIKALH